MRAYRKYLSVVLVAALLIVAFPLTALAAAPVAVSFSTAVPVTAQSAIQLQGSDADGTALTFATTTSPSHGALSNLNTSTGALVYTPTVGYTGSDSFQYTVTSGGDTTAAATVTLTVTAAKTRIIDSLLDPSGAPRVGRVSFFLTQVATSPSGIIPAKASVSASLNSSGQFDVSLYPSRAVSPAQYYQVWFDDAQKGNTQLIGIYDIPASTTTISLTGHRITDANLDAQFTFASKAEVDALTAAVAAATTAQLFPLLTAGHHIIWNGSTFANSIITESGSTANVGGNLNVSGVLTGDGSGLTHVPVTLPGSPNFAGTVTAPFFSGNLLGNIQGNTNVSGNLGVGGTMTGQVNVTGGTLANVTCTNCTNVGSATSGAFAATGDEVINFDSDANGAGAFRVQRGGVDKLVIGNDGTLVGPGGGPLVEGTDTRLPVTPPVVFADRYSGADWGAKVAAAITALPVTGGVIDARMLTGSQSLSSDLTISKQGVSILVDSSPTTAINMGTNRIVVAAGAHGFSLKGTVPQGRGLPSATYSLPQPGFTYTGTGYAILIGDATLASQTKDILIEDIAIFCTNPAGGGIDAKNGVYVTVSRTSLRQQNFTTATGKGFLVEAGTGTGTTYAAYNIFTTGLISGFKYAMQTTGTAADAANDNYLVNSNVSGSGPVVAGSIGFVFSNGDGNHVYGGSIEGFDTAMYVSSGVMGCGSTGVNLDGNQTYTVYLEAGAHDNNFQYFPVSGTNTDFEGTPRTNTIQGDKLRVGYDNSSTVISAKLGTLRMEAQGTGALRFNQYQGTGGAAFGNGTGSLTLGISGQGVINQSGIPFSQLTGGVADGTFSWCTDCAIATTCAGGGSGAWAFRSRGSWKCPF
ncbi:MAG: hypothetical protein QOH63_1998 [Acidobacteriota bacterium]|jgi:hypothetical protein|nr:hypothetical protein [Acidobacteriota bacterium]